jgi:pyruvate, orthophosphate dikinase
VKEGDFISFDGTLGDVYLGQATTVEPDLKSRLHRQVHGAGPMSFAASSACAPMPTSRAMPRWPAQFGAEGIGLCRTEHMFFAEDRLPHVQRHDSGHER